MDDSGSRADHPNGVFGAHLVRPVGEYGNDEKNNDPSSEKSEGAFESECMVYHVRVARRTPLDGKKTVAEGKRPGKTGPERDGNEGPGHDLSPTTGGKLPGRHMVEEKDKTSYRGNVSCVSKNEPEKAPRY